MVNVNPIKVSIIIPAYNVAGYIGPCIDSCLRQKMQDIEIIVVNDGSTDSTLFEIKEKIRFKTNVRLIDKQNEGVTSARQAGLDVATGEYVFFLDGDDCFYGDKALFSLYIKAKELDADYVAGDFVLVFRDGRKFYRRFMDYDRHNSEEALAYAFLNNDFYYTGRLLRQSMVVEVNRNIPHDITYGEDTYAVVNYLLKIKVAAKINEFVLEYVQRSDSVTNRLCKYDLEKRNKATSLTLKLADTLDFDRFARKEIIIYALRELYQSIVLGVPNIEIANHYLSNHYIMSDEIKLILNKKKRAILALAACNLPLTVKLIKLIKRIP